MCHAVRNLIGKWEHISIRIRNSNSFANHSISSRVFHGPSKREMRSHSCTSWGSLTVWLSHGVILLSKGCFVCWFFIGVNWIPAALVIYIEGRSTKFSGQVYCGHCGQADLKDIWRVPKLGVPLNRNFHYIPCRVTPFWETSIWPATSCGDAWVLGQALLRKQRQLREHSCTAKERSVSIELDDGTIYTKPLHLMVETMVSCRFSLKPIHWLFQRTCLRLVLCEMPVPRSALGNIEQQT